MSEPTLDGLYAGGLLNDWFSLDYYKEAWVCQNCPPIKSSDYIGDVLPGTASGIKLFRARTSYMEAGGTETMYLYSQQLYRLYVLKVNATEFLKLKLAKYEK